MAPEGSDPGTLHLEDDHWCYACGRDNDKGLRLDFRHPEKGRLTAEAVFSREHQGFKGMTHGGMVAMLLDEMMVNLAWVEGIPAVTAELTVRLKKPVKTGEKVHLEGRIEREEGRLVHTAATAKNARGELLAAARAVCLRVKRAPPAPLAARKK